MSRIYIVVFICAFTLVSCKDEKTKENIINTETTKAVQHYICLNKCENSGSDKAGNCNVCNEPLAHNTAYHSDEFLKTGPLNVQSNATQPTQPTGAGVRQPEPAQNMAGVYHYTCKNACAGGAGTATTCKSCGETLEHNTAYHN